MNRFKEFAVEYFPYLLWLLAVLLLAFILVEKKETLELVDECIADGNKRYVCKSMFRR